MKAIGTSFDMNDQNGSLSAPGAFKVIFLSINRPLIGDLTVFGLFNDDKDSLAAPPTRCPACGGSLQAPVTWCDWTPPWVIAAGSVGQKFPPDSLFHGDGSVSYAFTNALDCGSVSGGFIDPEALLPSNQ